MQETHVFADSIVVVTVTLFVAEINLIELSAEQLTLESMRWKQLQLSFLSAGKDFALVDY